MGWYQDKSGWQSDDDGWSMPASSGGGSPTWVPNSTQAAWQTISFGSGTANFSVTLDSVPSASDIILVGINNSQRYNAPIATATLNGSALTLVSSSNNTTAINGSAIIYEITGITSASLAIQFTVTGAFNDVGVTVGVLKNFTSSTATATGNNNEAAAADPQVLSGAITVPSSGYGIVLVGCGPTPSSSNSTIDTSTEVSGTGGGVFFAHTSTAGSWNPAISGSPAYNYESPGMAAAAWH